MRITARQVEMSEVPAGVERFLGQSFVTVGRCYSVIAIALFEDVLLAQVVDDVGFPSWRPLWLFEVTDSEVPEHWVCHVFHDNPRLLLGPRFIAESQASYTAMVELESTQVARFWEYVDSQR